MRIALLESIVMPVGHEVEFDRILVDEIKALGEEVCFFVPEKYPFKLDYGVPVVELDGGEAISYAGVSKIKKLWLSLQRETRRKKWFSSALQKAKNGECDAIIIPSATYRYKRAIIASGLKDSPVPVILILHGITPKEKDKLIQMADECKAYPNIHFAVMTLRDDINTENLPNIHIVVPPVYTPRDLGINPDFEIHDPLRLGFFGQYRKEKNVEFFLEAFKKACFKIPVELMVQGATAKPWDTEAFLQLQEEYKEIENIKFWHENLIGERWQKALLDTDVFLMPYGAERYRYHTSAMLFTAIGYYKPVLQSQEINPEILQKYKIGEALNLDSVDIFSRQLENFVNGFHDKAKEYKEGLQEANKAFSPIRIAERLLEIAGK